MAKNHRRSCYNSCGPYLGTDRIHRILDAPEVNRQLKRSFAHFLANQKAEEEARAVLNHLAAQDNALAIIHQTLDKLVTPQDTAGKLENHVDKQDAD